MPLWGGLARASGAWTSWGLLGAPADVQAQRAAPQAPATEPARVPGDIRRACPATAASPPCRPRSPSLQGFPLDEAPCPPATPSCPLLRASSRSLSPGTRSSLPLPGATHSHPLIRVSPSAKFSGNIRLGGCSRERGWELAATELRLLCSSRLSLSGQEGRGGRAEAAQRAGGSSSAQRLVAQGSQGAATSDNEELTAPSLRGRGARCRHLCVQGAPVPGVTRVQCPLLL